MLHLVATLGPLAELLSPSELSDFAKAIDVHGLRCVRPRVPVDQLPFETVSVPWTGLGRFLTDSTIRPGSFLAFAAGDYAVQDAASLLPLALMQLSPGDRVIDCCAAPGGKSAAILEQLGGTGLLVSNEVIASRVDTLQLTLSRTGYANYAIAHQPVDRFASCMSEQFDCVLVDAPCTGQSLVGRGKQSLSAFSEHQVAHSAARQRTILEAAVPLVRPGGRLVYSTCTFAFDENEGIMSWLRARLTDWQPVVLEELSSWQTPDHAGCYRLWPHRDRCAGGFAAAIVRPMDESPANWIPDSTAASRKPRSLWQPISISDAEFLNEWAEITTASFFESKHKLSLFSQSMPREWLGMAHVGIEVANKFGQHWQPAYPTAVLNSSSQIGMHPKLTTELTDQEALIYMTGTSVHRSGPVGWQVVTWRGRPLGWAKQVGTQLKNHLPKPLRQPNLRL